MQKYWEVLLDLFGYLFIRITTFHHFHPGLDVAGHLTWTAWTVSMKIFGPSKTDTTKKRFSWNPKNQPWWLESHENRFFPMIKGLRIERQIRKTGQVPSALHPKFTSFQRGTARHVPVQDQDVKHSYFCHMLNYWPGWWWLEPWNFEWLSIREWKIIPTFPKSIIFQSGRYTMAKPPSRFSCFYR